MRRSRGTAVFPWQRPPWPHGWGETCVARVPCQWRKPIQTAPGSCPVRTLTDTRVHPGQPTARAPHRQACPRWGTATRHQTQLEGSVAKSPTEWGSTFRPEESFWLLNLKIQYLWSEPFHKLYWNKKYCGFDFFFLMNSWFWKELYGSFQQVKDILKLNTIKSDLGIILGGVIQCSSVGFICDINTDTYIFLGIYVCMYEYIYLLGRGEFKSLCISSFHESNTGLQWREGSHSIVLTR